MTAKTRLLCLAVSTEIIFYKAKHTTYGCQCIPAMYKELPDLVCVFHWSEWGVIRNHSNSKIFISGR